MRYWRALTRQVWKQWSWQHSLGDLNISSDCMLPKKILHGEQKEGTRTRGGQKKRIKDNLKQNLKKCDIDTDGWETLAAKPTTVAFSSHLRSGSVRGTTTCWSRHKETKKEGPDISANSGTYFSIRAQYMWKRQSFANRPVQLRQSPQVVTTQRHLRNKDNASVLVLVENYYLYCLHLVPGHLSRLREIINKW